MKVLIVVDQLEAGGLERQLSYLIDTLSNNDSIFVDCFVWNYNEKAHYFKFIQNCISGELGGTASSVSLFKKHYKLRQEILRKKPNYVISFSNFTNFQVWISSLFTGTKPIGSIRSSSEYMLQDFGLKKFLSLILPSTVITNSEVAIATFKEKFWLKHVDYYYFPNFIHLNNFKRNSETSIEYTSISVSSLLPEKMLFRLVDLLASAKKSVQNLKHVHLGDGPMYDQLVQYAKEKGVDGQLTFMGKTNDVSKYLSASKIFVHFSDFEGTPNVVLEAMATGLPVVTTNCGDVAKLVLNGVNGFVIQRADQYSSDEFLASYLMLVADKEKYDQMSQASLRLITSRSSLNMKQEFLTLLNQIQSK